MPRPGPESSGMGRLTFVAEDAPDVPRGFVARPEAAEGLRSGIAGPGPPVVVLYGPAGAGKTTLAAAVARELAAGAAGRGCVLWLKLGDASGPPDGLMRAIRVIERHDGRPPSRRDTLDPFEEMEEYLGWLRDPERPRDDPDPSDNLRGWLSERACLMVLDDVSLAEEARPLLVGAAGCPTVLIARDVKVADDLAVPAVRLDAMDPGQSLALIESRVGSRLDPGGRASALQLAEAVGGLPLALEVLCAASSSLDVPWPALRDGVFAETSRPRATGEEFAGRAAGRPIHLRGVVGWVLRRLPADLREAFAWLGVLRAGATVSPELAGRLWGVDEGVAVIRLRRLAGVGLIALVGSAGRATANYRLHEAIRDEAWDLATTPAEPASPDDLPGLGLSPSGAHSAMLARLRDGGAVATSPAAAALHLIDHLPRNMEDVGPPEDVDALLGEETPDGDNAWYLAREHRGDRPGYLQDVDRAWRRADAASPAGGGPGPVARQCRYALIRASVAPEWPDPPPGLLALLVASGRWSTRRAEVTVRRIRYGWTRMSAWTALAPHLEGSAREDAARAALDEARKQRKPEDKARALAEVMPVLSPAQREAVLHEAVGLVQQAMKGPGLSSWPQRALIELVPHLDDSERADLLRLLVASPGYLSGSTLAELMTDLAARLGPDGYRDAVRLVLEGYRGELSFVERARILLPLGPPGDPGAYRDGLRQALDDARDALRRAAERDDHAREFYEKHGLGSHISFIPIDYFGYFSGVCPLLAWPDLGDLREEALAIARGARSGYRFRALAVLVPVMELGRAREVAAEALGVYRELDYGGRGDDQPLYSLLPFLEGPGRREAWKLALKRVRLSGIGGLIQVPTADVLGDLDEGELQELMEAIRDAGRSVRDDEPSRRPWVDVLPFLSEPRRREFLRSYPWIDDEDSRSVVLHAALPFLGVPLRPEWSAELIEAARSLQSTSLRAKLLAALLPHLDGPDRKVVLAEVLDAVRRIGERRDRVQVVRPLAEHLDATERGVALADLLEAACVPGRGDDPDRNLEPIEVFAALAPRLDRAPRRALLLEALGKVQADADRSDPDFQHQLANALAALGPCLAGPDLEDLRRVALTIARSLRPGTPQAWAVISLLLAPDGAGRPGRLEEALEAARGIDAKLGRVRTLVKGAEVLDGEAHAIVAREALEVARSISEAERRSNPFGIDERVDALTAVVPILVGPERDELARELFEEVRTMRDDRWRTLAFKELFTHLGEDQRRDLVRDARRTALQADDGMARFEALKLIAPSLTEGELVDALGRAGRERDAWFRREAMEVIARALAVMPPDVLRPLWQDWLRERAPGKRAELCRDLAAMLPVVAALGGSEAVIGMARAVRDVGCWWP
jgi:hypothetical protein